METKESSVSYCVVNAFSQLSVSVDMKFFVLKKTKNKKTMNLSPAGKQIPLLPIQLPFQHPAGPVQSTGWW